MVRLILTIIAAFILYLQSFAQRNSDIQSKREELNKIRAEIEQLDRKLKETQRKEKQNLNVIDEYDKQVRLLNSLIKKLKEEEEKLSYEIRVRESALKTAEMELLDLRNEYEKFIVNFYKYGRKNPLELLLTSQSVNQVLLRYKYLEKFTDERKRRIQLLNQKAAEVETERKNLIAVLSEKEKVKKEKTFEENQLRKKLKRKEVL